MLLHLRDNTTPIPFVTNSVACRATNETTQCTYDAFGNRTKETITNIINPGAAGGSPKAYGVYVYEYPAGSNRLSRILFNGQPQETYTYDNAGRITQRVHSTAGTTTYGYDDRGLLLTVTKPGTTVSYTYDALGVRKSKTVNGTRTNYLTAPLFGMSRVLAELNTNQTVKATYVYGGSQQIKEEPAIADRSKDLYLVHDGIVGNITHAIDMTGSLRNQYKYDAFGIRTQVSAAATGSYKHYGYTGEEYDEETGLLYLRARYYDPSLGRFISADPFWGRLEEPASQNRYVYVKNSPLTLVDPSGLDTAGDQTSLTVGGFGYGASLGYSFQKDTSGGSVLQFTVGGGKYTGNPSVTVTNDYVQTNAGSVNDLTGTGYQTSVAGSRGPIAVEGGVVIGNGYTGQFSGGGVGAGGPGGGGTAFTTKTWNIPGTYSDSSQSYSCK